MNTSKFVDFQKVRIQEVQSELPRGCIPRSLEVILRAECVERTQAGDRCEFIGTLIVVPDVSKLQSMGKQLLTLFFYVFIFDLKTWWSQTGSRTETSARVNGSDENEGVGGLKALGVRELSYKMAFLAFHVAPCNSKVG